MFSSILTKRICDRSAQFLINFFEKIVMAANNSGFYSTYLFVSEERRERERREGIEQELTGELALAKRIQVENLCSIWNLFTGSWSWQSSESSCHAFKMSFCTGSTKWNTAAINILLLFLAGLFTGLWLRNAPHDKKKSGIIVFKNKLLLVSLLRLAGLCEKS